MRALERARMVLAAMEDAGFIDEATRREAAATRPAMCAPRRRRASGYFVD